MQTSESIENIAPALIAAQAEFSHVAKGARNEFDKYDYATLEDYVNAVKGVLVKHSLALTSSVDAINRLPDRTTKKGGSEHAVEVAGTMRLIHSSGEWIEASFRGEGQDRADKSVYKAITGGRKYGIAALFSLATSDDPESDESVGQSEAHLRRNDRQAIAAAMKARGWPKEHMKEQFDRFLANHSADDIDSTTADQRIAFIEAIENGDHDPKEPAGVDWSDPEAAHTACAEAAEAQGIGADLRQLQADAIEGDDHAGDWESLPAEAREKLHQEIEAGVFNDPPSD